MTMPANRERDRQSLKDLAKMAQGLTPPPGSVSGSPSSVLRAGVPATLATDKAERPSHDSGVIDLAAASHADPGAAIRAQATPLATQDLFAQDGDSLRPGPVAFGAAVGAATTAQVPPSGQAAPGIQPAPTPSVQGGAAPALAPKASGNATLLIALGLGGILALSAVVGGVVVVRSRAASEQAPVAVTVAAPAVQNAAQIDSKGPKTLPTDTKAEAAPAPEAAPTALAVTDLAAPTAGKTDANAGAKVAAPTTPAVPVAAAVAPSAPKPKGTKSANAKENTETGPAGDLGAAIKKEVGGDEAQKNDAKAAVMGGAGTGNLPQKPSQGAVTGAIGAVLPGARACLGPDDPVSRASIVFGSSGAAQSVTVSGGAAGKPAEACIKDALMKAKLQPFADPTYSANITVRHN